MPGFIEITKGQQTGVLIGLTEKAGSTSIQQSIKHGLKLQGGHRAGEPRDFNVVRKNQTPVRIYLRHPIKRLISAWRYFYPSKFPERVIAPHSSFAKFVDHVLGGIRNSHWDPQLELYAGCNIAELYQFERIHETWPADIELLHLNQSKFHVERPSIIPRQREVYEHYREDLEAWASLSET